MIWAFDRFCQIVISRLAREGLRIELGIKINPFFLVAQNIHHILTIKKGGVGGYRGIAEIMVEHGKAWLETG